MSLTEIDCIYDYTS